MNNTALYTLTVLIWGSTFFAIEFQLGEVPAEVSLVYRFGAASFLLFAWCRLRGLPLRFSLRSHGWFALLGMLLFGINYILTYRSQVYITSALAAIAFASMVWLNIMNARLFFGVRTERGVLLGALLGLAGMVLLFAPQIGGLSFSDSAFFGSCLALLAALTASFGNMVSQATQRAKLPIVQTNAWGMFYGAVLMSALAIGNDQAFTIEWTPSYILSLAYLSVIGSIVAFGAYLTLLGRIGAHRAGYAVVMFPVVALLLSVLFEDLEIGVSTIAGIILVVVGNVLVLKRQSRVMSSRHKKRVTYDMPTHDVAR